MSIEALRVPSTGDATNLVAWYEENHRPLPWRATTDPYAIWISETMLQQTRVETVIPYYHAFLERYPTVQDLARADFEDIAKLWQGLGYYSRARNLHRAAQVIVADFDGRMPRSEEEIRQLPGIGPYTAGAVLSIAFNQPVPAVDGNVLRVMARFLAIEEAIELSSVKQQITNQVQEWLQQTKPSSLTQALMELGATVCTPRGAKCVDCPIQSNCAARSAGIQSQLPVRKAKQAKKDVNVYALWCEQEGFVLMHRRPAQGLLAGMWELPGVECPVETAATTGQATTAEAALAEAELGIRLGLGADHLVVRERFEHPLSLVSIATEKHVFTHINWYVEVLRPVGLQFQQDQLPVVGEYGDEYRWVARADLHSLVLPRVYERLIETILAKY